MRVPLHAVPPPHFPVGRLNVYFREMLVLEHRQDPAYTGFDMLSNIGGALGLWAGLSLITVAELFSLLGSVLSYCTKKVTN